MPKHSTPLHQGSSQIVPSELVYRLPDTSVPASRHTVSIRPLQGATFSDSTNPLLQFHIPSSSFVDFQNSFLTFKYSAETTGDGAYLSSQHAPAHSVFRRMRVVAGDGTVLEDVDQYGQLASIITDASLSPSAVVASSILTGAGSNNSYREANWNSGHTFAIKPYLGLWNGTKYFPAKYMSDGLYIECTMADVAAIHTVINSGTVTSYKIEDVQLVLDMVTFDSEFEREMDAVVKSKGLKLHYQSWNYSPRTVQASVQNQVLILADRARSIRTLLFAQTPSTNINNSDENEYDRASNNLSSYQFRIGTETLPQQPIKTSGNASAAYMEVMKAFGGGAIGTINELTYKTTRFLVGQNLDAVQSALSGSAHSEIFANIEVLLQFESSPAACQAHFFTHYDNVLEVKPTGQLERTY